MTKEIISRDFYFSIFYNNIKLCFLKRSIPDSKKKDVLVLLYTSSFTKGS